MQILAIYSSIHLQQPFFITERFYYNEKEKNQEKTSFFTHSRSHPYINHRILRSILLLYQ